MSLEKFVNFFLKSPSFKNPSKREIFFCILFSSRFISNKDNVLVRLCGEFTLQRRYLFLKKKI